MAPATLPILPASLAFEVNGVECEITGRPNKAETRIWYSGSIVIPQTEDGDGNPLTDPAIKAALGKATVTYQGETLNVGEVHVSAPRLYKAGHVKAGQAMPGTGGNLTVTHSVQVTLTDQRPVKDGEKAEQFRFNAMVTLTFVADKGFVVSSKAIPQADREPTMSVSGDLTFV